MKIIYSTLTAILICATATAATSPQGILRWHPNPATLDADLNNEPLTKVLADIRTLTGWEIWIEPQTQQTVSTRFIGLPINQGLRRILGDLNFAILPGEHGNKKLHIYRHSISAATQTLPSPPTIKPSSSRRLENEIIITLAPDTPQTIETIAAQLGAEIIGKIPGRNAYRLRFQDAQQAEQARQKLAGNPAVELSDNYEIPISDRLTSLNFGTVSPPRIRANTKTNQNQIIIGLIDTPVQTEGSAAAEFLLPTLSIAGEAKIPINQPTHGTTMAETMLHGIALANPDQQNSPVRILPIDVYGNAETTSTFQVAAGIIAAIDAGAGIINLSLGGQETTPFLQNLIIEAHQQGILFIGAAGNEPDSHNIFPAAYPQVIAVTSSDPFGNVAPFANSGNFVDVMAPGHSYIRYRDQTYLINGTSTSAAYVSGIAAGLAATSDLPPNQIETQLRQTLPKPPGN